MSDEPGTFGRCCVQDCCGAGSYCCRYADPHAHCVTCFGWVPRSDVVCSDCRPR